MAGKSFFVRIWPRLGARLDMLGAREHRAGLTAGLSGRVLELGCGDGRMFDHYPPAVTEVLAVEPEPALREHASAAAASAPIPVTLVDGHADEIPTADGTIDHVVCSLVLCSVPDQRAALAELHRVLKPGGELHYYEHVVGSGRIALLQRVLDGTRIWPTLGGGCHLSRDTTAAIAAAGFEIGSHSAFRFPDNYSGLPHILGRARRR